MKAKVPSINAMAFYHSDGFVPAWKQAVKFAGEDGHVGTMLDVVDARIATGINQHPWNTYYTTTSAEYFGYGADGRRKIIVAHGVGPMSTLDGILKAYSFQYKDKTRNKRGGRISQEEFLKLEAGEYGEVFNADDMWMLNRGEFGKVAVVDFDKIVETYEYPFMGYLTIDEALREPLLWARLGPRVNEYLLHHATMARQIHLEEHRKDIPNPYIVKMAGPNNCLYTVGGWANRPREYPWLDRGDGVIAHLLSTGRLSNVYHERERRVQSSVANDIGIHEWSDSVRLVAVRSPEAVTNIHPGVGNIHTLVRDNWQQLMRKVEGEPPFPGTLYALMAGKDNTLFTQYQKQGARMDTHEPEFLVTNAQTVGKLTKFTTTIGGYPGFFKYDIKEVAVIKPPEANAYTIVGEIEIVPGGKYHRANIQFYRVEVDTSQRLMRADALENDYDLLMGLLAPKAA